MHSNAEVAPPFTITTLTYRRCQVVSGHDTRSMPCADNTRIPNRRTSSPLHWKGVLDKRLRSTHWKASCTMRRDSTETQEANTLLTAASLGFRMSSSIGGVPGPLGGPATTARLPQGESPVVDEAEDRRGLASLFACVMPIARKGRGAPGIAFTDHEPTRNASAGDADRKAGGLGADVLM